MPSSHDLDSFGAALAALKPRERRFVARVLAGDSYAVAAESVGFRGRIVAYARTASGATNGSEVSKRPPYGRVPVRLDPVMDLLGRVPVASVLKRFVPLLADPERVRELLAPFATQALAASLDAKAAATRQRAAIEITSPSGELRRRAAATPSPASAGAAPSSPDAWERQREEAQRRRALLREAEAHREGDHAPAPPRALAPLPPVEHEAAALPDDRTLLDPDRAAG